MKAPLLGYRLFIRDRRSLKMWSLYRPFVWEWGWNDARCCCFHERNCSFYDTNALAVSHWERECCLYFEFLWKNRGRELSCGFYAFKEVEKANENLCSLGVLPPSLVVAEVELAGIIAEHEFGYRATKARIKRIL